jgi:predicted nucleic acid-binding protein
MSRLFVLDASIIVKWFFVDEPQREKALEVRSHLVERPNQFMVPILFHSELLHVLTRKSERDSVFVTEALEVILKLGIRAMPLSADGLHIAAKLCCDGLSGYDATYAALAQENKAKWLTADAEAVKRIGANALALGQYSEKMR